MARIAGVDLPREKRVDIGLTYIFGIGRASALQILKKSGVGGATRVKDLSEEEIVKLREVIERDHQRACRSEGNGPGPTLEPERVSARPSERRGNLLRPSPVRNRNGTLQSRSQA